MVPSPWPPSRTHGPGRDDPRPLHAAGEALGALVPQAVLGRDGRPLDIDLVLSEAASDGGELVVEFGPGPLAFQSRRGPWIRRLLCAFCGPQATRSGAAQVTAGCVTER